MQKSATVGRLIYVMGPSGSGKDSVINYARDYLARAHDDRILIARRYITRAPETSPETSGESHIALSPACFAKRQQAGEFALSWQGNGLSYGISHEIDDALRAGRHVIVNGSRAHLSEVIERYPTLLPVLIVVDPAVLQIRLLARGRESRPEIASRIERARSLRVEHPALQVIGNDGPISRLGEAFLDVIRQLQRTTRS